MTEYWGGGDGRIHDACLAYLVIPGSQGKILLCKEVNRSSETMLEDDSGPHTDTHMQ